MGFGNRSGFLHLTPALSAPGAERETARAACAPAGSGYTAAKINLIVEV